MHVSSTYLLQNRGGVWKVDSASGRDQGDLKVPD